MKTEIEFITTQAAFDKVRAYVNSAASPEDRNLRKLQMQVALYNAGPKKFSDLIDMKALVTVQTGGEKDDNQKP